MRSEDSDRAMRSEPIEASNALLGHGPAGQVGPRAGSLGPRAARGARLVKSRHGPYPRHPASSKPVHPTPAANPYPKAPLNHTCASSKPVSKSAFESHMRPRQQQTRIHHHANSDSITCYYLSITG